MTIWTDFLLQENGSYLLQENGFKIVLEQSAIAVAVIPRKLGGAWFAIPEMRKALAGKEKIYLKEMVDELRR